MKKIYLSLFLCFIAFSGFAATTWYTLNSGDDAASLSSWNSAPDGSGTTPTTFSDPTDTWVIDSNMNCSVSLTIGGSVNITGDAYFIGPNGTFTIGGNLSMSGNAAFDAADDLTLNIGGNLSIVDNSYITNEPAYTTITFNNTSSSISSPQTITWTSTAPGDWAQMTINANCVVRLLTNVNLPPNPDNDDVLAGTLICDTFVLSCNGNNMDINDGATLYTANAGGVDASIINETPYYSQNANYVFNGYAAQVTGTLLPSSFFSGSVSVNNASGVTLTDAVVFNAGSTMNLINGGFDNSTSTITLNSGANINRDNGTLVAIPSFAGPVNVTYTNLGFNSLTVFADNELPTDLTSLNNLTVSKVGATIGLIADAAVNGTLTLNAGLLDLGYAHLTIGLTAPAIAGTFSASSMILANEGGYITKVTGSDGMYFLPLGDNSGIYSPISISMTAASYPVGGANLNVNLANSKQPANANVNNYLSRYWNVNLSGFTSPVFGATAQYDTHDVIGTESAISAGAYNGSLPWMKFGAANTSLHTLTFSGLSDVNTSLTGITTAAPVLTLTHDTAVCPGGSIGLMASAVSDSPFTYTWSPAASLSASTGASVTAMPSSAATYTVTVTDGNGFTSTGMVTVTINALPTAYGVTGGGNYCVGGTGSVIGLSNSDAGISYQLYAAASPAGSPVSGSSAAITFGSQTTIAPYTVIATNTTTGCTNLMSGSVSVSTNPLPAVYAVTGGGGYCAGSTGVHIGLANSDGGINYQTYSGGVAVSAPFAGSGSALDMGIYTTADTYMVMATNTITGCMDTMASYAVVVINPLPIVYDVTGGGNYCAGGIGSRVYLDSANAGINYQLYLDGSAVGSAVAGADTAMFSFGYQTGVGNYTAVASDATTGCTDTMSGSVSIDTISVVVPTVSLAISTPDTICAGTSSTFTATGTNGGSSPVFLWKVNGTVEGTDSNAYAYVPSDGQVVSISYISSAACAIPDTVTASITMSVYPNGTPTISITSAPGDTLCVGTGVTLSSATTFGGTAPTFTWVKNTMAVDSGATYSFIPADGDAVYCVMTSNYRCRLSNTAYSLPITYSVQSPVAPIVSITGMPSFYVAPGHPDTLVATVVDGGSDPSFQWYYNGSPVPGATSSVFRRTSYNNGDSVSCVVTSSDACHLSSFNSVIIHVTNVGVAAVGNGIADIRLLPNPNNGTFTVTGNLNTVEGEATMEIVNMTGQVVFSHPVTINNGMVNEQVVLSNALPAGTYLMGLRTGSGNSVIRFVIE
jgi:Secretion system C-terminal sorting domain